MGALGEDGLKGAFALCPQVVTAVVVNHARLRRVGLVRGYTHDGRLEIVVEQYRRPPVAISQ